MQEFVNIYVRDDMSVKYVRDYMIFRYLENDDIVLNFYYNLYFCGYLGKK